MNYIKKRIAALLLCVLLLGTLSAVLGGCAEQPVHEGASFETLADFATARIGIMTGSSHDLTVKKYFPDAKRTYFSSVADMVLAVEQGKIDGYIEDENFFPSVLWEGAEVKALDEAVSTVDCGFAFPKGASSRVLREQMNMFLAEACADGTVERLYKKWTGPTEPTEHPDYEGLRGENGTLRLATVIESKPMLYLRQGKCTGFEMDLLTLFGEKYGYAFDITNVPFDSVIAGMAVGKYDLAASALNITPERAESVDFSVPYGTFDVVMVTADDQKSTATVPRTLSDFEHGAIGVMTGTVYDDYAKELFPEAERHYYSMISDLLLAVKQGKVDGIITENTYVTALLWEGEAVETVSDPIARTHAGYVFAKDDASAQLREQLDAFILKSRENGYIQALEDKWLGSTEPTVPLDFSVLTGENGTLRVAVAPDLKPISYYKDNAACGYEVELLLDFAKEYGYALDISYMTFDAILPGVVSGKYDIGTGATTITEERTESVDFSESHLTVEIVMLVSVPAEEDTVQGWMSGIVDSFEKTFIRESRWKMLLEGIGVTLLISLCSVVAGSALGFGLYLVSCSEVGVLRKLARGIARVYTRIIEGTPVVVVLMVLFYVVFGGQKDISGVPVAILGFSLTFGAFVYEHMHVMAGSVNYGQTEAAYALGYTKRGAFFRIVFPQAMTLFLPAYCAQAVEMIKATAVVGYIAVTDLTKMSDIIRSNTYEAFFPLIATALIYFLLTWGMAAALGLLKRRFEPKRRSKQDILKGVKTV